LQYFIVIGDDIREEMTVSPLSSLIIKRYYIFLLFFIFSS
jgi:hypothetical protein